MVVFKLKNYSLNGIVRIVQRIFTTISSSVITDFLHIAYNVGWWKRLNSIREYFLPKGFHMRLFFLCFPWYQFTACFFLFFNLFPPPFILLDSSRHLPKRGGDNHKLERQSRDFYEITTIFFVRFPFGEQKLLNESLFIISIEISRIFWLGLILRQSRLCVKILDPTKGSQGPIKKTRRIKCAVELSPSDMQWATERKREINRFRRLILSNQEKLSQWRQICQREIYQ